MRFKTLLAALLALMLIAGATASAYTPRHGKPCRKGYAKHFKVVKRNGHRHRVRICVKRKPRQQIKKVTKLHAHLDPSYTRNPLDPFEVTYAYSASATQEQVAAGGAAASALGEEEPASLPSGVLALYSDGKLECAINVGGSATGSQCPVAYQALGDHTVTTIYASGENSATATEIERIEPLATTTILSVNYIPYAGPATSTFGCGEGSACHKEAGWHENGGFDVGVLTVHGEVTPGGAVPLTDCPAGDSTCRTLALDSAGSQSFTVHVLANYVALEEKDLAVGDTLAIEPEAIQDISLEGLAGFNSLPAAEVEAGVYHFTAEAPARAGYLPSSALTPIQFSPSLGGLVERVP